MILVLLSYGSGRAGSGKSEAHRLVLNYLLFQSNRNTQMEQLIMEASVVLEARPLSLFVFCLSLSLFCSACPRFRRVLRVYFSSSGPHS